MRSLVTGGAGFIGSHLVDRLLREGHEVTVVDNLSTGRRENLAHCQDAVRLVEADVRDFYGILPCFEGQDRVFHLAALADIVPSIVNPIDYCATNVTGTMHVVEAARRCGVGKLVYAASSSCYGIPPEGHYPTAETAPTSARYPYALTKHLGEQTVIHWGRVYDLPVLSLRLFNVYGPRSRTSGAYGAVFGVFLAQKLNGKPFTVVGDGEQTRDFVFVTDVADAFFRAAGSEAAGESVNIASGRPQSVNRLVALLGGDVVHIPKRPGEPDCTWGDIRKAESLLGWRPSVSFEEGVGAVLENIEYWRTAPVWTPESIAEETREWFRYLEEAKT